MDELPLKIAGEGPLTGMVLGIKNQFDVSGATNWWSLQEGARKARSTSDATAVARLREAGAIIYCTTAAPWLDAPGGVTPQTLNPRSPDRVSGGSSGGSAAAVAAGLVHAALGSDSGGSIRIPAACCGVVGLQTTRGLVSLHGSGGLTYSVGNVGPLAATTADARRVLDAIAGFDPLDPYSLEADTTHTWDGQPLRIGLPEELAYWNIDSEVAAAFEDVLRIMVRQGHVVDRVSIPILRESIRLGPGIVGVAESAAVIQDRLGDDELAPEAREAVRRSKEIPATTVVRAMDRIATLRRSVDQAFAESDLLLLPTLPCRVPEAATQGSEAEIEVGGATETRTSALTRLVNPWNLAGAPAGSLPVARDSDGSPISIQIVGPAFSDWKILDFMAFIEADLGGPWDTVAPAS